MNSYCAYFGAEAFCADGVCGLAFGRAVGDRRRRRQRDRAAVRLEIATARGARAFRANLGRSIPGPPGHRAILQAAPAALALASARVARALDFRARRSKTE